MLFPKEVAKKSNTSCTSENFEVEKGFPDHDALLTQKVLFANIELCQSLKLFKWCKRRKKVFCPCTIYCIPYTINCVLNLLYGYMLFSKMLPKRVFQNVAKKSNTSSTSKTQEIDFSVYCILYTVYHIL
jgi:hypothetical protein